MHHGHADGVTFAVQQASVDVVIVESVVEEDETDSGVDVDEDRAQHGRHAELEAVLGDTLDNVLQLRESILVMKKMSNRKLWYLRSGLAGGRSRRWATGTGPVERRPGTSD